MAAAAAPILPPAADSDCFPGTSIWGLGIVDVVNAGGGVASWKMSSSGGRVSCLLPTLEMKAPRLELRLWECEWLGTDRGRFWADELLRSRPPSLLDAMF